MINLFNRIFKRTAFKTAIHPDCKRLIEKVATIKGRDLYQFKSLLDMPHKRYNECSRASTEFNMRIDLNSLQTSIKDATKYINEGNITKVASILNIIQAQTEMALSIEASYRLASIVYFWKDENLDDYDYEIGDEKIKLFKEMGFDSFFLSKPMNNFLPEISLSASDLNVCLAQEKNLKNLLLKQLRNQAEQSTKTT